MFDIIYGIMFLLLSTTLIISILVVVLYLSNRTKKQEVKSNEAEKSIKKLIYCEATNELEMEGPATPEPKFRWFTCKLHETYATKKELRKLVQ